LGITVVKPKYEKSVIAWLGSLDAEVVIQTPERK
jgi:hypothetical protein